MPDCKPVSVPLRAAIIHLGHPLLDDSSDLPESPAERAAPSPLFGLAPRGVYPAGRIAPAAVRSYRTFSPLPAGKLLKNPAAEMESDSEQRQALDSGIIKLAQRTANSTRGVFQQLPAGGIFSVALSVKPALIRTFPAVSRHAALRRPDFPPVKTGDCPSGKLLQFNYLIPSVQADQCSQRWSRAT